jgi:protein-S-isoprenylcysteine O-methyltransferase Ste14
MPNRLIELILTGWMRLRPYRLAAPKKLRRARPDELRRRLDDARSVTERARPMSGFDRAEGAAHRLGALVAIGAASTALPGMVRAVREPGPAGGHPELVFTPLRLLLIGAGWFGAAAAAWHPLPVRPSHAARWVLLGGGLGLYLAGMGLALAGRIALGSSYRPSSTLGVTLAASHRLVTSGPFAVVRHPMYLGLALAAIGALAVYRTWSTMLFVLEVPVLVVRARHEEELLARTFGEAWDRYAARVPAWLPRRPIGRVLCDPGPLMLMAPVLPREPRLRAMS